MNNLMHFPSKSGILGETFPPEESALCCLFSKAYNEKPLP